MLVLRQIDPVGVHERARHRIVHRIYTSRVRFVTNFLSIAMVLHFSTMS